MTQHKRDRIAELREEFNRARRKGKWKDARKALMLLRGLEPREPRWPHQLGEVQRRLGDTAGAVEAFEAAVDLYVAEGFIARAVAMAKTLLLLDPSRDVKRYGTLVETGTSDVLSVLVRDPKKPEFGTINLIFVRNSRAPGGYQLTNWVAQDAQNHRTTVRLSNHRYGMSVGDSTFRFRDPRRSSRRPR